jgi:hypothetical protein
MRGRLWVHELVAVLGVFLLILLGCQGKPKVAPPSATSSNTIKPIPPSEKPSFKRGTIFFLKEDARLSPGALNRLKTWTTAWGVDGKWVLAYPSNPEIPTALNEKRIQILRSELQKLGVTQIETRLTPNEPAGQYDAIHIEK